MNQRFRQIKGLNWPKGPEEAAVISFSQRKLAYLYRAPLLNFRKDVALKRTWTDEQLGVAVKATTTYADLLRKLDLRTTAGNYRTLHRHILRLNISTAHFVGKRHLGGKGRNCATPLSQILIANSTYTNQTRLKIRLLRNGLLKNVCYTCGQTASWLLKPLVLIMDHINGNHYDNRLENLRMLCPNCNSQTVTFSRKHGRLV